MQIPAHIPLSYNRKEVTRIKIICISGHAQNGKDTTAQYMKEYYESDGSRVLICHYGDLVKYICEKFFGWDGEKNDAGRTLLQRVGTDVIRSQQPGYWVDFIASMLRFFPDEWDYVLIPDARFPNEIDGLRDAGFDVTHVRVVRDNPGWVSPLTEEQQNHPSETALDDYEYDYIFYNRYDLEALMWGVCGLAIDIDISRTNKTGEVYDS